MSKKVEVELSEKEVLVLITCIRMSGLNRYHDRDDGADVKPNRLQKKVAKILDKLEEVVDFDD